MGINNLICICLCFVLQIWCTQTVHTREWPTRTHPGSVLKTDEPSHKRNHQRAHPHEPAAIPANDEGKEDADESEDEEEEGGGHHKKSGGHDDESSAHSGEDSGEHDEEHDVHTAAAHQQVTAETDAVASMLLAMFTFQITLFYMVNHYSKSVRYFTWQMISATISIFASILLWTAISTAALYALTGQSLSEPALLSVARGFRGQGDPGHGHHGEESLALGPLLCLYAVLFLIYHGILCSNLWKHELALEAFATLGAHTMGFASVQVVGTVAHEAPWNTSWVMMLYLSILSMVVLLSLNTFTSLVRKMIFEEREGHGLDDKQLHKWKHVYKESENEFAAFAIGLMFTLTIQFLITGEEVPYHGNPYGKSTSEVICMFLASSILALFMMLFISYGEQIKAAMGNEYWERAVALEIDCTAFTFGWCLLFACRCFYWCSTNDKGFFYGDQMTARVIQALTITCLTIVVILVLKGMEAKYVLGAGPVSALMTGFGLMLGLSWEGAFYNAIEDITDDVKEDPFAHLLTADGLGLAICLAVLPAWYLFVHPQAHEAHHYFAKKGDSHDEDDITLT